ncbi:MAG: hypothetical protein ACK5YR_00760 [Pirellula sp.]|jgi:hypothetical protein
MKQLLLLQLSLVLLFVANPIYAASPNVPDLFVGPFSHWIDVKVDFGAVGDGIADDTVAL